MKRNIIIGILLTSTITLTLTSINLMRNTKQLRVESDKNLYIAQEYSKELEKRDSKIKELESIQAKYDSKSKEVDTIRTNILNNIEDSISAIESRITNENSDTVKQFRSLISNFRKNIEKTSIGDLVETVSRISYYGAKI